MLLARGCAVASTASIGFKSILSGHTTHACCAPGTGFPPVYANNVKAYLTCVWCPLVQDRIGIDVQLLDEMQKSILGLYRTPPSLSPSAPGQRDLDAIQESINGLCSASIQTALYKAAGQLLDDLHRNVRLLGTPERSVYKVCGVSSMSSHHFPLLCRVLSKCVNTLCQNLWSICEPIPLLSLTLPFTKPCVSKFDFAEAHIGEGLLWRPYTPHTDSSGGTSLQGCCCCSVPLYAAT